MEPGHGLQFEPGRGLQHYNSSVREGIDKRVTNCCNQNSKQQNNTLTVIGSNSQPRRFCLSACCSLFASKLISHTELPARKIPKFPNLKPTTRARVFLPLRRNQPTVLYAARLDRRRRSHVRIVLWYNSRVVSTVSLACGVFCTLRTRVSCGQRCTSTSTSTSTSAVCNFFLADLGRIIIYQKKIQDLGYRIPPKSRRLACYTVRSFNRPPPHTHTHTTPSHHHSLHP